MKPFKCIWHLSIKAFVGLKCLGRKFNVKNIGSMVEDMSFKDCCQDNYCVSFGAKTSFLAGMLIKEGPLTGAEECSYLS